MEGYSSGSSGLEPAFEADDKHGPAKCKARNSNSNIKEHHYIIITPTHGSKRDLFIAHDKDQTSACKEETGQGFRWRARGKHRARGAEPDKDIGQGTQNCESGEAVAPESMYLNLSLALAHAMTVGVRSTHLEKISLEVSAHCRSGHANHQRGERIKAAAVTCRFRDSTAVSPRGL